MKKDREFFEKAIKEWIEYYKTQRVTFSSNPRTITECEAYRNILSMSYEALPLIRKLYDKDDSDNFALSSIKKDGLRQLVHEIIGRKFQIPKKIRGDVDKTENYIKNWLDENMHQYLD